MFDKITQLEEKLIKYISDSYPKAIEDAKAIFLKEDDSLVGFDDWLCFGHLIDGDKNALSLYTGTEDYSILKESRFSFYEVVREVSGLYFKDIFTNDVFKMDPDTKAGDTILSCRIYKVGNAYYYLENGIEFAESSKSFLVKAFLEKYNSGVAGKQMSLEGFLKANLLLIHKFSAILFNIEVDEDDEAMTVNVCTYAFKNRKAIKEAMKSISNVLLVDDEVETVYSFTFEDKIVAEIVLLDQTIEVECNTMSDIDRVRNKMETIDGLTFIKVETLSLSDLL